MGGSPRHPPCGPYLVLHAPGLDDLGRQLQARGLLLTLVNLAKAPAAGEEDVARVRLCPHLVEAEAFQHPSLA